MRYCIWNNKGGVGKTFLTYLIATEYALKYPDKEVVVIDMCPQANVSEIILGGNGKGQSNLEKCFNLDKTIASYIKKRYSEGKSKLLGSETTFFVKAKEYNENLPENIWLLPGDSELDICSGIITYLGGGPEKKSWINSRYLLLDLINSFANNSKREQVYFFDCNPSFAPYTELAIVASNRLIVPCTADNASIRGLKNIFKLLYGSKQEEENQFTQFYEKIMENKIVLPVIHRVVQNKSRSHEQNASKVFQATLQELKNTIASLKNIYKERISEDEILFNIKDGNTLAAVINHTGKMLNDITIGEHEIYDMKAQVSKAQKDVLIEDVKRLVSNL